jgi:putative transposase
MSEAISGTAVVIPDIASLIRATACSFRLILSNDTIHDTIPIMVNYRRNFVPGGTFFFTVTLADRRSTILVDHVDLLRHAFRTTRHERPFTIDAIAILPEHLHVILTLPPDDADFSARWRRIKGLFASALLESSMDLPRRPNGDLALWQRRFWEHTIRDESDFARHVDYIHFNPIKHALVQRVRDWPHSSFHRYVREGLLPDDWAGDMAGSEGGFGERWEWSCA